jgi:hypothetical protein
MSSNTPSPTELLEQTRELGARIGALSSLGAGITAAIGQHTIEPEHVYLMIDGYVANLVTLTRRLEDGIAALALSATAAHAPANRGGGDELDGRRAHNGRLIPIEVSRRPAALAD